MTDWLTRSFYFENGDGNLVGIHAIGLYDEDNKWQQSEAWGNIYNDDMEMQGRGSFRVFDDLDNVLKDIIKDGYEFPINPS